MLAFRPGRLTREHIMGKRARYIAPVPLFLLVVFLMFFVFSFVHLKPGGGGALNEKVSEAQKNPQLTLYKIQNKVCKFSCMLVPLSLPWLWLMFAFRRNVRIYDHAVLRSIRSVSCRYCSSSAGSPQSLALPTGCSGDC